MTALPCMLSRFSVTWSVHRAFRVTVFRSSKPSFRPSVSHFLLFVVDRLCSANGLGLACRGGHVSCRQAAHDSSSAHIGFRNWSCVSVGCRCGEGRYCGSGSVGKVIGLCMGGATKGEFKYRCFSFILLLYIALCAIIISLALFLFVRTLLVFSVTEIDCA